MADEPLAIASEREPIELGAAEVGTVGSSSEGDVIEGVKSDFAGKGDAGQQAGDHVESGSKDDGDVPIVEVIAASEDGEAQG